MKVKNFVLMIGMTAIFCLLASGAWADGRRGGDYRHQGPGYKQGYHQKYDGHRSHYRGQHKRHYRNDQHRHPGYRHYKGYRHHDHHARKHHGHGRIHPKKLFWLFTFGALAHHAAR